MLNSQPSRRVSRPRCRATPLPHRERNPPCPVSIDRRSVPRSPAPAVTNLRYLASLDAGTALVLVNDHDPNALNYQLAAEKTGEFFWDHLQQGQSSGRCGSVGLLGSKSRERPRKEPDRDKGPDLDKEKAMNESPNHHSTDGKPENGQESALEILRRWETAGGHWRVLARNPSGLVVALLRCDGGEEAQRFTTTDPALATYIGDRQTSDL
jgi:uncharacterized protein (DUF2249 family)